MSTGGCHHTLPLTNETMRDSPAPHLHPVESITSYNGSIGDKPMDIDGKNDECDIDTGDYFKAISDLNTPTRIILCLYISTLTVLGTNLHIC